MIYNPNIHHRRSIRLKDYDYSQAGLYCITICIQDKECRFGQITEDEMFLNELGIIAYNEWLKLPERFINCELDVFQIMPNHMHGIIILNDIVGAGFTPAHDSRIPIIGDIVGAYKSLVSKACLEIYRTKNEIMGKLWQRNYHEHVIRNEQAYQKIADYIIHNPMKWIDDQFYKK
jgi:putative transposase